jgi:hypothetical protein
MDGYDERYEELANMMAELVAGMAPEEYERMGPALREFGLAIAEMGQAGQEARRMNVVYERAVEVLDRALEDVSQWRDARDRVLGDLDRAEERAMNAFRLLEDGL